MQNSFFDDGFHWISLFCPYFCQNHHGITFGDSLFESIDVNKFPFKISKFMANCTKESNQNLADIETV